MNDELEQLEEFNRMMSLRLSDSTRKLRIMIELFEVTIRQLKSQADMCMVAMLCGLISLLLNAISIGLVFKTIESNWGLLLMALNFACATASIYYVDSKTRDFAWYMSQLRERKSEQNKIQSILDLSNTVSNVINNVKG